MAWFECTGGQRTPTPMNESYIYSVGQVGFNTGHVHTVNTKIKFKAVFDTCSFSDWGEFFGARNGNYWNNAFCFFTRFQNNSAYAFCRTGQEILGDAMTASDSSTSLPLIMVPCIFEAFGNKIEWHRENDEANIKSITASNSTIDAGIAPLAIYTFNNSTTANGWSPDGHTPFGLLYWFEIYESDVLEHRFVPAYHNNQWCLYDEVDETYIYDVRNNGSYLKGYLAN